MDPLICVYMTGFCDDDPSNIEANFYLPNDIDIPDPLEPLDPLDTASDCAPTDSSEDEPPLPIGPPEPIGAPGLPDEA